MSLGLFDVQGGVGEAPDWELTSPMFDEIHITTRTGHRLEIRCSRTNADAGFIRAARFNGRPLDNLRIPAAALAGGGLLEIELGPRP